MPALTATNLCKTFAGAEGRESLSILRDVSLSVDPGDSVAVVGPSGCGKSTLLHLLGGLDRPTDGSVRVGDREISSLSDRELAEVRNRDIGFVFQQHRLLPQCTALENVLVPALVRGKPDEETLERGHSLLDRVGLGERLHHRPGQLSGGEGQRVALVRALINRPRIVLADEPTGSLDGDTADRLADLLVEVNRQEGVALVVVTHAGAVAERMDRTYQLSGGHLESVVSG